MRAILVAVALGLAAGAGAGEALVFRGTATTGGNATVEFDINGCAASTTVSVSQGATAQSTCTALVSGLNGQCELDAARVAQLQARQAELHAQLSSLETQIRQTIDEMERVARRLERAAAADPYVVFACGARGAYRVLGKIGGEVPSLTSQTVSDRGYEVLAP